jgi:SMC interacting uncharacterized protein involved in chromosome segregation
MIPIETIAGWIGTGIVIIGHVATSQYKLNQAMRQLDKLWDWKDSHEKDVADKRLEFQKQFGSLEGKVAIHDGNYTQILSILAEIKTEIKELRSKK